MYKKINYAHTMITSSVRCSGTSNDAHHTSIIFKKLYHLINPFIMLKYAYALIDDVLPQQKETYYTPLVVSFYFNSCGHLPFLIKQKE